MRGTHARGDDQPVARILTEWLPSSGYRWESKTDVERYFTPRMTAPDSRSEVWLPVVKA